MVCKKGHEFHDALACPECAKDASEGMLRDFLERAVRSREKTYRTCDHIVVNAEHWKRALRKQGVGLDELLVPSLCGALVSLAEVTRMIGRIHRAASDEQLKGKCPKCESRLIALTSESGAHTPT